MGSWLTLIKAMSLPRTLLTISLHFSPIGRHPQKTYSCDIRFRRGRNRLYRSSGWFFRWRNGSMSAGAVIGM